MATYNLNTPEEQIITSWLFEQSGYLDNAINNAGVSARQALAATPGLNVLTWIRTNTVSPLADPDNWNQCAMVWWIRINNGVNVTPPNRPPERTAWRATLTAWRTSIDDAFIRVSQAARDGSNVTITAEDGTITTRPSGQQLVQQRSMIDKVLQVM